MLSGPETIERGFTGHHTIGSQLQTSVTVTDHPIQHRSSMLDTGSLEIVVGLLDHGRSGPIAERPFPWLETVLFGTQFEAEADDRQPARNPTVVSEPPAAVHAPVAVVEFSTESIDRDGQNHSGSRRD